MALVGHLHPLVIHFPIALVIVAAAAEAGAIATRDRRWTAVAVINLRVGAAFAVAAAVAGWQLASMPGTDPTPLLQWHRWLGLSAALVTLGAAASTFGPQPSSSRRVWRYRVLLLVATVVVAATGHLGGQLVWGADFLRR